MFMTTLFAIAALGLPADMKRTDPHSLANTAEVVRAAALDLDVDFGQRRLAGQVDLSLDWKNPAAREIVLDNDGLVIRSVRAGGRDAAYTVGEVRPDYGAPMTIQLNGARTIEIEYESAPNARALQWLEPAQTASGKRFLFSQGQSINNRTWIPTQDSPGIRQTYDARIVVPEGLKAVMSAQMLCSAACS